MRVPGQFAGHVAEFVRVGAVLGGGDDVFGGASQLEEPVDQRGEFGAGQHDGVFGKAGALDGASSFVGALAAGLTAVLPPSADGRSLFQQTAAPAAVPDSL